MSGLAEPGPTSPLYTPAVQEPEVDPIGDPFNDFRLHCYVPRAENIAAEIVTDSSGTETLNVTWVSTRKPPEKDSYCAGSRKWHFRALMYDSHVGLADEDFRADDATVMFQPTARLRQTHFELSDPPRDKYYIFQVQNSIPSPGGTGGPLTFTYASYIYYFGNQSEYIFLQWSLFMHVTCMSHAFVCKCMHVYT